MSLIKTNKCSLYRRR